MEKVDSFKIDHMRLVPGIYIARTDAVGNDVVTTFDIRVKRPNFEDAMTPEVSHTIEHLGAAYLRNHPTFKDLTVYFGPMGCLTGFYLILKGNYVNTMKPVVDVVLSMMKFIVDYDGNMESMGFDAESCGNYTLNDLSGAKTVAANFIVLDETFGALKFEYPTAENSPGIMTSTQIFGDDKLNRELKRARTMRQDVRLDYEETAAECNSYNKMTLAAVIEETEQHPQESFFDEPILPADSTLDVEECGDANGFVAKLDSEDSNFVAKPKQQTKPEKTKKATKKRKEPALEHSVLF